jgi:hypothetical protein
LTVIELDGVEHDPVTVQNVDIYAGASKLLVQEELPELMDGLLFLSYNVQLNVFRSSSMLQRRSITIGLELREFYLPSPRSPFSGY